MKIAFIYPGDRKQIFFQPPLSLGYLASYAMKYGGYSEKDVRIIDENAGDDVVGTIAEFRPDIIGITTTTPVYPRARELAKRIKGLDRNIPIIIGGPHVTAVPETTMDEKCFDAVVMREGEKSTLELLKLYEKSSELTGVGLSEINGIAYFDGKSVRINKGAEFIKDLDSIPFPARSLMKMDFYLKPKNYIIRGVIGRITQMMSSRGCPYDCIYCSNNLTWKRKVRYFSPEYVVSEVEHVVKTYGVEGIYFIDDTFCADRGRMKRICELLIEKGLNRKTFYSCQLRANLVDKDMLRWLKDSGCIQVEYGFESGSERVLKRLKKNTVTVEQNKRAALLTHEAGLRTLGNFIIGAPGETIEDIRKTEQFYKEAPLDFITLSILTPYPGTEVWNDIKDSRKFEWERFWMGLDQNNIIVADKITEAEFKKTWIELSEWIDRHNIKFMKASLPRRIKYFGSRLLTRILPRREARRKFKE